MMICFQKIAELRLKSNAHGRFVNDLLVNEPKFHPLEAPVQTSIENDPIDNKPESAPSLPTVELPSEVETHEFPSQPEPLPQSPQHFTDNVPTIRDEVGPTYEEQKVPQRLLLFIGLNCIPGLLLKKQLLKMKLGLPMRNCTPQKFPAEEPIPLYRRRLGYFFGPFIGPVFPDDSAIRPQSGKEGYQSDTGITAGLRFGNDFGFTRIEGEYGFLTHNIHSPGKSGDVQLHNLQSRLILEKSLAVERT